MHVSENMHSSQNPASQLNDSYENKNKSNLDNSYNPLHEFLASKELDQQSSKKVSTNIKKSAWIYSGRITSIVVSFYFLMFLCINGISPFLLYIWEPILFLLFLCGFSSFIICYLVLSIHQKCEAKQQATQATHDALENESFYISCNKEGITNLDSQIHLDRMLLIADRFNIIGDTNKKIEKFEIGKAHAIIRATAYYQYCFDKNINVDSTNCCCSPDNRIEIKKLFDFDFNSSESEVYYRIGKMHFDHRPRIRKEESAEKTECEKYLTYRGREKRIQMLLAKRNTIIDTLNQKKLLDPDAFQKKEHDWATMGGLATGIAGGAAGVATAIDYQIKNAEIRRNNADIKASVQSLNHHILQVIHKLEKELADCNREIESAHSKLVGEISTYETEMLMQQLSFSNEHVETSITGAVRVNVQIAAKNNQTLYEGQVNARIDGFICAELIADNIVHGTAVLTLPVNGIGKTFIEVTSICTETTDAQKIYTVRYKPICLWKIEN